MTENTTIQRVIIDRVRPEIDSGRFPIKRALGEKVKVRADIITDGHDAISGLLLFRHERSTRWHAALLKGFPNDKWKASFKVTELGRYVYTLCAWLDRFKSWRRDLAKRLEAGQDVAVDLLIGAALVEETLARAPAPQQAWLAACARELRSNRSQETRARLALDPKLLVRMEGCLPDRFQMTFYPKTLAVVVDPAKARFSTWYEMFPRSCSPTPGAHGTFADCEARLPYISDMGFDVLYLPPIHPIGTTHRKGRNNSPVCGPGDPGSPWAIGAAGGGTRRSIPSWAPWMIFASSSGGPRPSEWTSPWIWRFSAARITRMSASTRNGSGSARTAPSSTPKTRRRNTKTSIRSTSNAPSAERSWTSCCASSGSGSNRASGSSGWTTPTPSPSASGSG
jgi:starch synthase (maltosyl-transferring)